MVSVAFLCIGYVIDWRSYISQFSMIENPFNKIQAMYTQLVSNTVEFPNWSTAFESADNFFSMVSAFFSWLGQFFVYVGAFIANCAVMIVYVPYTLIEFVIRFTICAIGINSITPYVPKVL